MVHKVMLTLKNLCDSGHDVIIENGPGKSFDKAKKMVLISYSSRSTKLLMLSWFLAPDEPRIAQRKLGRLDLRNGFNIHWIIKVPVTMSSCVLLKDQATWYVTYEGFAPSVLRRLPRCNRKC